MSRPCVECGRFGVAINDCPACFPTSQKGEGSSLPTSQKSGGYLGQVNLPNVDNTDRAMEWEAAYHRATVTGDVSELMTVADGEIAEALRAAAPEGTGQPTTELIEDAIRNLVPHAQIRHAVALTIVAALAIPAASPVTAEANNERKPG